MAKDDAAPAAMGRPRYRLDEISDDDPDLKRDSYAARILDAYVDMRRSTRAFIEIGPSEARLLFLALLSDVIFLMARSLSMVIAPPQEVATALPLKFGAVLIVAFLLRTSIFYVSAALATAGSRVFGGRGSWYETRCAVFWAALVSAPVEVFGAAVSVTLTAIRRNAPGFEGDWLVEAPYYFGPIAFGYFLAAGVAEAQGFRYTWRVMAALAIIGFGALWLVLALS